jgi:CDP-diacylglycerol--serine O-phosphatidyltransferase
MIERPLSPRRGVYLLPNLFTLAGLFSGFYAIIAAMQGQFHIAAMAIFLALIFDGLDGRVARLTNTATAFGAQLDSLSDMVCFGVAPALVMYFWSLHELGKVGWLVAFIYVVCTALRLARFNIRPEGSEGKRYSEGITTTMAAGFVASLVWVCFIYHVVGGGHAFATTMGVMMVLIAILKVSTVPFRSFKDFNIRDRVPFIVMLILVLVIVLVAFDPPDLLLAVFGLYLVSGPIGWLWRRCFGTKVVREV